MGLQVKSDVGRDWERSWKKKGWSKENKDKWSVSDQSRSHLSQIICTVMFMFMCHILCVIEKSYLNHTKQGIGARLAPWCGILEASTVLTYDDISQGISVYPRHGSIEEERLCQRLSVSTQLK